MWKRLDRLFLGIEWKLSLFGIVLGAMGGFALPAWAFRATGLFSEYAPFSWVMVGFAGLLTYALAVFLLGIGRSRFVRSKYDASFMQETGGVDPLAKVFESKRIYLNDLVLPSNARVIGKTFVGCEIVGPANMYLERNNNINNNASGQIDAVALSGESLFYNGIAFVDCVFKDCTFHRVTAFINRNEVEATKNIEWLNWITLLPVLPPPDEEELIPIEDQSDQSPTETEEETQR